MIFSLLTTSSIKLNLNLKSWAVECCTVQFVYEGVLVNVALSSLSVRACSWMLHCPVCLWGRAVECCTNQSVYEGVLLNVALSTVSMRACCWMLHCPVCLRGRAVECCTVQFVCEGVLLNVALSSLSTRACCWMLHCPVCLRGCAISQRGARTCLATTHCWRRCLECCWSVLYSLVLWLQLFIVVNLGHCEVVMPENLFIAIRILNWYLLYICCCCCISDLFQASYGLARSEGTIYLENLELVFDSYQKKYKEIEQSTWKCWKIFLMENCLLLTLHLGLCHHLFMLIKLLNMMCITTTGAGVMMLQRVMEMSWSFAVLGECCELSEEIFGHWYFCRLNSASVFGTYSY